MIQARSRGLLALFIALAIVQVVPVWPVKYIPTGDGPSHVYNAWVMNALLTGDAPPNIEAAYHIDWRPHPNWTGHAFMALAMFVVPPLVAEKLLLTLIIALLLAGTWMLVTAIDPRNDVYAFLAFAFTYPQTVMAGYYNYSLSIGLFLIILGVWWRNRDRPGTRSIAIVAALLVLCYFTHPLATLLACGSIAFLSILARRPRHLLALLPAGLLLMLFGRTTEAGTGAPLHLTIDWGAAYILTRVDVLHTFDLRQRPISLAVSLIYAVLIAITLIRERHRPANGLGILALLFIASMFWLPAPAGTRALFTQRMSLFVFLMLAAWFTPKLTARWRVVLVALMSAIAIANAAIHVERFRFFGRELTAFVRSFDPIQPESTFLPLVFTRPPSASLVPLYTHAISYVALQKRLTDLGNYEPASNYFPVGSRIDDIDASAIEATPGSIDIARHAPHAAFVATIDLPAGTQQRRDLAQYYRLIAQRGALRIYRRAEPLTSPHDLVLLPLLGTRQAIAARWRVEQSITNRSSSAVRVLFRNCLDDTPCELDLNAGETRAIASGDARMGFLLVPPAAVPSIDIRTTVRRTDRPDLSVPIPAVHESQFVPGTLRIRGIDTRGNRINLRAYLFTDSPWEEVTMRLRATGTGALIGEQTFYMAPFTKYEDANLNTHGAESVDLELVVPSRARLWAFATALNEQGQTRVHLPSPPSKN